MRHRNDVVNELIAKAAQADGFVFGTPVYYAHPSAASPCALDRAFYAGGAGVSHFAISPISGGGRAPLAAPRRRSTC